MLDHERARGQEFVIDAVLGIDTRPAAATDDLATTVDYGALADRLAAIVAGAPVDLIETLAERLAPRAWTTAAVAARSRSPCTSRRRRSRSRSTT